MNYTYLRNPERLLLSLGFNSDNPQGQKSGICLSGRKHEREFMDTLHRQEAESFRELLIVVGGFMDGLMGNAYAICRDLPEVTRAMYDIYYREHSEGGDVRELVELYRHRGKNVTVVGHSWGGHAVVHDVACRTEAAIHLLITLDPVSRRGTPETCPINVQNWINVYVDYTRSPRLERSNVVARIGGPWRQVACAHVNRICEGDVVHHRAGTMFHDYALPAFSRVHPDL